jgi:hypothetical protein
MKYIHLLPRLLQLLWFWKGEVKSCSRHCPCICLEGLGSTTETRNTQAEGRIGYRVIQFLVLLAYGLAVEDVCEFKQKIFYPVMLEVELVGRPCCEAVERQC